jgi:hypothetical protein
MSDPGKHTFFIKLTPDGIGLNPDIVIPFTHTNLPSDGMRFRDDAELYWEVQIQHFSKESKTVVVGVSDYAPEDITLFFTQQPRTALNGIEFSQLDWNQLSPHLSSYRKAAFSGLIGDTDKIVQNRPPIEQRTLDRIHNASTGVLHVEFSVSFDKATFVTGGVLVLHKFRGQLIEILIPNGFILKEFDLLKHYITRLLGQKRFHVNARITLSDDDITDVNATSPEIDRINEEIFDAVRYLQAKSARKSPPPDVDRELFTSDELLKEESGSPDNGLRLLEIILRDDKIRNKQQIIYLAGKLHTATEKILFTSHPQFGFVFHVRGNDLMHFVWELLNSHATYVWSYDPKRTTSKLARRRLEYALSTIREEGRQSYRIEMPHAPGMDQLHFSVIRHDKIAVSTSAGFAIWRVRLQERLV